MNAPSPDFAAETLKLWRLASMDMPASVREAAEQRVREIAEDMHVFVVAESKRLRQREGGLLAD